MLRRDHSLKIQQFRRQRSQRIEASRALCRVETLLPALQGTLLWQPGAAQAADSRESRESRTGVGARLTTHGAQITHAEP